MTPRPLLLDVLAGERPARVPVWLMRQAGRFLPEYRALRERRSFLDMLRDPELGARVTMLPMRRFDLDAAILFTDLLVPLEAMGVGLDYKPGPEFAWTVRDRADLERLGAFDLDGPAAVPLEAARLVRAELDESRALLGFVGAPFTLAAYLVEGKGSKAWVGLRALARRDPELFTALLERLADAALAFGKAQVEAGCDAVQVFDSWAGVCEPRLFEELVAGPLARLVRGLRESAPVIYFVNGATPHLPRMLATGADCLGLDWRCDLDRVLAEIPARVPVQGNLDPTALFAPRGDVEREVRRILDAIAPRPHVFNLGHGLDPATPVEAVGWLVDEVRRAESRRIQEEGS